MKTNPTHNPPQNSPHDPMIRILDANANRACEGLRTLEDLARFVLNNSQISGQLKDLRHELRAALDRLPLSPTARIEARDTPGDVGTPLSTQGERSRAGLNQIASAGSGRATESLRVLEETSKVLGSGFGDAFESIRYRVYEIAKQLQIGLSVRSPQWRLCVLLTTELCNGRDPASIAAAAIEGGADCLQIREKAMDSGPLLELTRRVVECARPLGVVVIVNDRADIAKLAGADGVHVGQCDLTVAEARRIAGAGAIVGVSTSNIEQARQAVSDGASYCGCGPMFASTTKAKPSLAGPKYLAEYLADEKTRETPHLAISGITPANAGELARAGCSGIAVSSVVCGASDPREVCQRLISALRAGSSAEAPSPSTLRL